MSADISLLWRYKRYIMKVLFALKVNKKNLLNGCGNDALHDFRVALRRALSIDILLRKSLGLGFDEELVLKLKSLISISSQLRDIEELIKFAPQNTSSLGVKRDEHLKLLLETLKSDTLEQDMSAAYKEMYIEVIARGQKPHTMAAKALEIVINGLSKTSKRYAKLIKDENIDFEALHSVRKKCKRYRYQLDFLFLDGNEGSAACKRVQDKLGRVNDLRMWLGMVDDDALLLKIRSLLALALEEAAREGLVFASKEYCASIGTGLRRRLGFIDNKQKWSAM